MESIDWESTAIKKKKKNKIMPFAATWMDLEMITLSEFRKTNSV